MHGRRERRPSFPGLAECRMLFECSIAGVGCVSLREKPQRELIR
jgi:hypothetical protein